MKFDTGAGDSAETCLLTSVLIGIRHEHVHGSAPTSSVTRFIFEFWILTAVAMHNFIFWDIAPIKVNRRFGGTYRLHLQCRRSSHGRHEQAEPPAS